MAGKIPDDTLQAIRERVSIVEVISGYVSLKKTGRNYTGLCPFHAEKTPSFTVSEERGLFHCFGCSAGGTVFTFLMRADRVDFRTAVEILARRAGVPLPRGTDGGQGSEQRQELLDLNEAAQRYFREVLRGPEGARARQYLEKRGVSPAIAECYGIGFCPPTGGGLARALRAPKAKMQKAMELGLIGRRTDGSVYDRFWARVTFPIRDGSGRIVGFGGRTLGTEHPKYLNSPESVLFRKGHVLYGLFEARDAIRDAGRVVITEGYLDALALVEAGIGYAVASLGTALTATHLRLARRFAPDVVVFFDGDRAGEQAAMRAFGVCAEAGVWGLGAFLPHGFDPDSFVRERGAAATTALLAAAVPLADFLLQRMNPGLSAALPERARAAQEIGQIIVRVRDPFQFSLLAQQAAQQLGVDEAIFRNMWAAGTPAQSPKPVATKPLPTETLRPEEATLLEAMALDRDVAHLVAQRGVLDQLSSAVLAAAGQALVAAWARENSATSVIDQLPPALAKRVTAGLLGEGAIATGDCMQAARDCIERIESRGRRSQDRATLARLKEAEATGDATQYRQELERNNDRLRQRDVRRE